MPGGVRAGSPLRNGALKEELSELSLSVTIGIARAHTDEADLESLIKRADQALYAGKRDGRNRVVLSEDALEEG
ncbi:diguanylate cyclase domain-containing protein [Halomonas korlensis]|uniref:diguanylate cyclase domain-containing protein n=1 Tax=Halomonas korlensis TaxID=463301 RepID=UPI000B7F4555